MTDMLSNVLTRALGGLLPGAPPSAGSGFTLQGAEASKSVAQAPAPANATDARINGILMGAQASEKAAIEPLLAEVRRTNPDILPTVLKLIPEPGAKAVGGPTGRQAESLYVLLSVLADPSTAKEAAGMLKTLAGQNTHVVAGSPSFHGGQGAQAVTLLDTDWRKVDDEEQGGLDTPVNGTVIMVSPYGSGASDFPGRAKKLDVDPQDMLRNLRNESFHAISANAAMSKASADGKLPEPYRNVVGAWNEIQGFNYEIGSSVQEAFPFGSAGSPKFEEVEKSLLASLPPGRFRSMQEYFVDAYGSQMVKTAKAALEGKQPEPVSDLLRRFVAPNLSPQDGARFDAFMNDLIDKTKTAIREFERENPGVSYERLPGPIIDKVWEAIGGNKK